ncbi:MAG TPA: hypothetical protein VKV38_09120 [Trebonia sp.]|jgi:hypothetical protein|nr:hypothetical protein [Trebonia sp.]
MRITFRRFPGGVASYSEIERDDGAVFRMAEFTRGGARLPHDLRHLIVELELGITDGIWGTIADGGIYTSMRFTGGHRLPHDAARKSDALKKARRHRIARAELFANLAESIAALDSPADAQVREIVHRHLAAVPLSEPGQDPAHVVELPPSSALVEAAAALRTAAQKWATLPVGAELSCEWTPHQPPARTRAAVRQALTTVHARPRRMDGRPRRKGGKDSGKAEDRHGWRRREPGRHTWRLAWPGASATSAE